MGTIRYNNDVKFAKQKKDKSCWKKTANLSIGSDLNNFLLAYRVSLF